MSSTRHGHQEVKRKRATHCWRGHEYTPENSYIQPSNGARSCRACRRLFGERPRTRRFWPILTCRRCGELFRRRWSKLGTAPYCSNYCRRAPQAVVCGQCGASFDLRFSQAKLRTYCSQRCAKVARRVPGGCVNTKRPGDRARIWVRDGGLCHLCGSLTSADAFHLDHVVPRARGGTDHESNLRVACPGCNIRKGPSVAA